MFLLFFSTTQSSTKNRREENEEKGSLSENLSVERRTTSAVLKYVSRLLCTKEG